MLPKTTHTNRPRPSQSALREVYTWAGSMTSEIKAKAARENGMRASLIHKARHKIKREKKLRGINYAKIEKIALPDVKLF